MIKKRILLFALLVFSVISYAQSYKFIYELDWKSSPDSSTHKKELFVLLTEENQPSYFAEYEKFKQDSVHLLKL
ncbi:hypothetical protein [Riemerella columbina]|uniref:hypothetical protein n=1 Tax=Riemerella columbina TaxID=103810 RepID=UPI00037724DB|nr:hypothetical protein [Riemerella columbina]